MRSTLEDTTTKARIRDAAIVLFGRDGFASTSVRAIAKDAGVSAALVIHHFGSKEGLRRECDEFVFSDLVAEREDVDTNTLFSTMQRYFAKTDAMRPEFEYLGRMLMDDSPESDHLFDEMLTVTRRMLETGIADASMNSSSDVEMLAVMITINGIVPLLLSRHILRALGHEKFDAALLRRMVLPSLELYTHGMYANDTVLQSAKDALARLDGNTPTKGPGQ